MLESLFLGYFAAAMSAAIFSLLFLYPKIVAKMRSEMVRDLTLVDKIQPLLTHRHVIVFLLLFNFFVLLPKYYKVVLFDEYQEIFVKGFVTGLSHD